MSTGRKLPLSLAQTLAAAVVKELAPVCARIEIAGSVRRGKPEVSDIEICAIPQRPPGLFECGSGQTPLDFLLADLVLQNRVERLKNGDRYKQLRLTKSGVKLDLFLCDVETWGCIFAIRTGPAEFSKRLVTKQSHGGLCPDYMQFRDGLIWDTEIGACRETPEERDVFSVLGAAWVEPRDRG